MKLECVRFLEDDLNAVVIAIVLVRSEHHVDVDLLTTGGNIISYHIIISQGVRGGI